MTVDSAPEIVQLERQVERGQKFVHTALGEGFTRLAEVEVFLHGLIDSLLANGVVTSDQVAASATHVRDELAQRGDLYAARARIRPADPEREQAPPVAVNCQERLPICRAACCRLDFALSVPEVESGKVKWDLGRPYFIRHDSQGSCVHADGQSGRCRIYADRPGVCRQYSCATDSRIWKNFERMELNHEWIDARLSASAEPRVVRVLMHGPEPVDPPSNTAVRQGGTQ